MSAILLDAEPDALPEVREAFRSVDQREPEMAIFGVWWARHDPKGAYEWSMLDWRAGPEVVSSVFRTWAQQDPIEAFIELNTVPERYRPPAVHGVISGWYQSGKPGLVERIREIPDLALRQQASETLARRLVMAEGFDEALRFSEGEPTNFRNVLARRIASAAVEQGHGARVAAWAEPHVTEGDERPSALPQRIATRWVRQDPEAAFAWLASLPAGKDRDGGVMEAFRDWRVESPVAAWRWIQDQELERWLEPAYFLYVRGHAASEPAEALDLAQRMSDPKLRNRATVLIARQWAKEDPEAAKVWFATADLPEDVYQRASGPLRAHAKRMTAGEGQGEAAPQAENAEDLEALDAAP